MTLIIGIDIEVGNKKYVYLAGDKCGSNGFTKDNYTKSKIFKRDDYAFGYTTSFRMGQILEFADISKDLPSWKQEKNLYTSFVDWVRNSMDKGGFLETKSGVLKCGNFIFYNGNILCEFQDDLSVLIPEDGLMACGSGEYHAKAIMRSYMSLVNQGKTKFDVDILIKLVYDTVSSLITTVSDKYDVICLKEEKVKSQEEKW